MLHMMLLPSGRALPLALAAAAGGGGLLGPEGVDKVAADPLDAALVRRLVASLQKLDVQNWIMISS